MTSLVKLNYTVEPLGNLHFGGRKSANVATDTLKYVSGQTIRGAVAEAILSHRPHDTSECNGNCDFCELFIRSNKALFRNAYPTVDNLQEHQSTNTMSHPAPFTLLSCKENPEHRVFDGLISQLTFILKGLPKSLSCPTCKSKRLDRINGFYNINTQAKVAQPIGREQMHVAIDRYRKVAADKFLYSLITMDSNLESDQNAKSGNSGNKIVFRGEIICHESMAGNLAKLISQKVKLLGGSKSRGHGETRITVQAGSNTESKHSSSIRERIKTFNNKLLDQIMAETNGDNLYFSESLRNLYKEPNFLDSLKSGESGFFTIDLISEAILPELININNKLVTTGRYQFTVRPEHIQYYGNSDSSIYPVLSFGKESHRGGWNNIWKLPKPINLVSQAGGVFVFWTKELSAWLPVLENLELYGVGDRCSEGFGQIVICAPIHCN